MPYNKETNEYEIDYNHFSCLNSASDNVLRYVFYFYLKKGSFPEDVAQIRAILNGDNRSKEAMIFLCQNERREFPTEDFDIISDQVSKIEKRSYPSLRTTAEVHIGECVLGNLKFNFEYEITTDYYKTVRRQVTKVVLDGDDFVVDGIDLFKACNTYLDLKKEAIEEENRKKSFRIISDRVSESYTIMSRNVEHHVGECMYGDLKFKFEYESNDAPIYEQTPSSRRKTVILDGSDFVAESQDSIYDACKTYFEQKARYDEEVRIKKEKEEEERIWVDFRYAHLKEIKDWLSPILEMSDCIFCKRVRWMLTSGFIDFRTLTQIERGFCNGCTGWCRFPSLVPEGKEHCDKWYELGLDKFDFKHIK